MKKEKEPTIKDLVELIDNLAITVAKGFERTATKADLEAVNVRVSNLESNVETIKRDVAFIRSNFVNREEFEDLVKRVIFLESRVGTKLGTRKLA